MHFEREDFQRIINALGLRPMPANDLGEGGYEAMPDRESTARLIDKYPPTVCKLCGGNCNPVKDDEDLLFICEDCGTEYDSKMVELIAKHYVGEVR